MNAEQIAKLKELAQKAIDNGPGKWPFHSAAFKAHITPAAVLELIALAEKVGDHPAASGDVQIGSKTPREQRVYSQGYYAGRKKGLEEAAAAPAAPVAGAADTTTIITAELNVMVNHEIVSVVGFLLDVAQAAHLAMQDCEDCGDHYKVQREDFDALNAAMEKLEALPDDRPGYTLSGPGKAEWALRDRGEPTAQPQPVAEQGELPKPKQGGHMDFAHEWSLQMQDGFSKHWMHPVNQSAHQLEVFKAQHEGYQAGWRDCARAAIAASQQPECLCATLGHSETVERIKVLMHGIDIGEYPGSTRKYLADWLDKEQTRAASQQAAEPVAWEARRYHTNPAGWGQWLPVRPLYGQSMAEKLAELAAAGFEARPLYAAPAIQQPQDEREAFEAWARDPVRASKLPLDRWPANDAYKDSRTYTAFYGWQARAALAGVGAAAKPNADCSGDPANCPDNEGHGCACDPLNTSGRCGVCAGTGTAFGKTCDCMKGASHG